MECCRTVERHTTFRRHLALTRSTNYRQIGRLGHWRHGKRSFLGKNNQVVTLPSIAVETAIAQYTSRPIHSLVPSWSFPKDFCPEEFESLGRCKAHSSHPLIIINNYMTSEDIKPHKTNNIHSQKRRRKKVNILDFFLKH